MGTPRGTSFTETMVGTVRLAGEARERTVRLDLAIRAGTLLLPHRTTNAAASGRVRIDGLTDGPVSGDLEISPVSRKRIRYRLEFTAREQRYTIEGWKSVSARRPMHSMTTLPYSLLEDGRQAGQGVLRFPVATGLLPFLASWRFPRPQTGEETRKYAPRWNGTPGRTEVWYTTLTDPSDGTGVWLHQELVAPTGGGPAQVHGWIALYPPKGQIAHARFGPRPSTAVPPFSIAETSSDARRISGTAGPFTWDLTEHPADGPLYTLPRWAWRHPVLPAAHMLPAATSRYTGTITHPGGTLQLAKAPGATARIYGHGSARRWAWLHADLGHGDVLELVAATSKRPGLNHLPPLVFLRLRRHGRDWPRHALRPAIGWAGLGRFKARLGLPEWTVTGRTLLRRIRVTVTQPPERTLTLEYTDPDNTTAVCRNSEAADAEVVLERWWGHWRPEASWTLAGTAHAEIGDR